MRRARVAGAVLVAGSATPRPESVHALPRLRLPSRVDGQALPPVEVVDMREARRALHPRTHEALAARAQGDRAAEPARLVELPVLPVVRAGVGVPVVRRHARAAPGAGAARLPPLRPPRGRSVALPGLRVGVDRPARHRDRAASRRAVDVGVPGVPAGRRRARPGAPCSRAFEAAPRGILVGTQMVAKGHDFPDVDLGVVLDADATLRFPDFRAEERTFALVTQLAGRAGRGAAGGRVLVQTLAPDAPVDRARRAHDADAFVAGELEWRRALRYPPFSTLVRIVCSARARAGAARGARAGGGAARASARRAAGAALGPAPLFRLRGRERSQVVVKATDRRAAVAAIDAAVQAVAADRASRGVSFSVDVDPQ